jgi:hypothetical protein
MKVVLEENEWYPVLEICTRSHKLFSYVEVELTQEEFDMIDKANQDFSVAQDLLFDKWLEALEKDDTEKYGPKDAQGVRWSLGKVDI